jgi:peptidoglycan/xylan/chitin deacetylase (PgdA/CDA1 family)
LEHEIAAAEEHIEAVTGQRPRGFRGPGFACNERILGILARRGYDYDCSLFPTFLGPLARAYYFMSARRLSEKEAEERKELFGGVRDGLRPIRAFRWRLPEDRSLLEIPVTTTPLVRTPLHLSYILYLARFSRLAARAYLTATLTACRAAGVEPSILLHPLDFMSAETCPELRFFPAMDMPEEKKLAVTGEVLDYLREHFDPVPLREHARRIAARGGVKTRAPDFA